MEYDVVILYYILSMQLTKLGFIPKAFFEKEHVAIFAEKQISHFSSKKKEKREEDDLEIFANLISQSSVQLRFIVQDVLHLRSLL